MPSNGLIGVGVVALLFGLGTACADDRDSRASEEASLSASASPTSRDESLSAWSSTEKGVRLAVPSHCGVLSVIVNGRLWLADPPFGNHNPPRGWDENETMGVLVKAGSGRAVFHGDEGQRASFRLAPLGVEDPNGGCD
jgi:hypothetical protein